MNVPAHLRPIRQYLVFILFILATPILASIISSYLKVDVKEAFECWCRQDSKGSSAIDPLANLPRTELVSIPVTLTTPKQIVKSLPTFGSNPFQYSISFWIKIDQTAPGWRGIVRFGPDDGNRRPGIWVVPNASTIHYRHASTADGNQGFDGIPGVPLGGWTHFAMTVSGRVMTPYINGVAGAPQTAAADLLSPTDQVYLPQDPASYVDPARPLNVAYAWFFNKALSAAEVATIYRAPHAGF